MGMYKYIREKWKNPKEEMPEERKERVMKWRKEGAFERVEKPTRLDKARNLGYKSKQGFVVVRTRVKRGASKKRGTTKGRRSKRSGKTRKPTKSKQRIAEERVSDKFPNLRVLNSYWVGEDGKQKWFEVILVDPDHGAIKNDSDINWICEDKHKDRAKRGMTSAAKN
ncbi:MAG: 50S ribosomal protein L15e [Candidatus Aenigmatarchaeota archaeon]